MIMNSKYWVPHFSETGCGFVALCRDTNTSVVCETQGIGMRLAEAETLCKKLNQLETAKTIAEKVKSKGMV